MERSLRRRDPSPLSTSLQRQVNMYALAARAVGIASLACAQSSEAKVVYTPAHKQIQAGQHIALDLNHDGVIDFKIRDVAGGGSFFNFVRLMVRPEESGVGIWGHINTFNYQFASALPRGVAVDQDAPFYSGHNEMAVIASSSGARLWNSGTCGGPWANVKKRYLGLKFQIDGKNHFGWARLSVTCPYFHVQITATLTGYAYETEADQPITTGAETASYKADGESQPRMKAARHTLGRLALGSQGLTAQPRSAPAAGGKE